jgi:hypothetical protein
MNLVWCAAGPHLFIFAQVIGAHNHGSVEHPRSGRESRPVRAVGLDRGGDQPNIENFLHIKLHTILISNISVCKIVDPLLVQF